MKSISAFLVLIFASVAWAGTPIEAKMLEMRNNSEKARLYRAILKHPEDHPKSNLANVKAALKEIEDDWSIAQKWTHPAPEIEIPHLAKAPVIDGNAESGEWQGALERRGSYFINSTELQNDGSVWRLGWYKNKIYGSVSFSDSDMTFYRGRQGEPRTSKRVWQGDCLEVFVQPDEKVPYYVELLLRPELSAWVLDHVLGESGFWTTIHFHFAAPVEVSGRILPDGYTLEFSFEPGSFDLARRDRDLKSGETMRMAMVCMNLTLRESENTVQQSFFPLLHSGHNIFGYAKIKLK
ncbi:MAG: hypothetical protein LBM70_09805 [Victivallales bacterium]|jgi:hypothetical protein|nr:hypothetical protein [Victivallales bacterium]